MGILWIVVGFVYYIHNMQKQEARWINTPSNGPPSIPFVKATPVRVINQQQAEY